MNNAADTTELLDCTVRIFIKNLHLRSLYNANRVDERSTNPAKRCWSHFNLSFSTTCCRFNLSEQSSSRTVLCSSRVILKLSFRGLRWTGRRSDDPWIGWHWWQRLIWSIFIIDECLHDGIEETDGLGELVGGCKEGTL